MGGVYNISISQDQFQNNFILDNDTTYHLASPLLLTLIHRNFYHMLENLMIQQVRNIQHILSKLLPFQAIAQILELH